MGQRGIRETRVAVTVALPLLLQLPLSVTMLGVAFGQVPDARAGDRPCVPAPDYYPPPPYSSPARAVAAPYERYGYGAYGAERPPPPERMRVPVEITATAGYTFSTGVPVNGGVLAFGPSPAFGATIDIGDWFGARFEAAYMLQWAGLQLEPSSGGNVPQYTVTAHHFQLGGEFDILRHGAVRPFLGILAGAVWFAPQSDTPDELWFEGSIEAGAKVRITKAFGIRAQAMVTGITMDSRSQIFCPTGCYTEWYGIGTSQISLTAGPTMRF
jgi:hypothetical protein